MANPVSTIPAILGIHIDTQGSAAALYSGGRIVGAEKSQAVRGQGERIMPLLRGLMADAQMAIADIECIAVNVGPGSFTGIRIGLAAAQGLAMAAGKKIFGVPHPAAVAASVRAQMPDMPAKNIFVCDHSGKGDYHIAAYDENLQTLIAPQRAADIGGLKIIFEKPSWAIAGTAASFAASVLPGGLHAEPPDHNLASGACLFAAQNFECAENFPFHPLYFRDADVTIAAGQSAV